MCVAQKYNTVSPARARTRTARYGDQCTNHEANTPPTTIKYTAIDCTDRGRLLKETVAFIRENVLHEESSRNQSNQNETLEKVCESRVRG